MILYGTNGRITKDGVDLMAEEGSKRIPNGPGSCYMTPDRVRWLSMLENAAARYDTEQYQEWLKFIRPASTDAERIERAEYAHMEIRRRYS